MGKPALRAREEQARNLGRWLNANICSLNKPLHEHPRNHRGNLSRQGLFTQPGSVLLWCPAMGSALEEQLKPYV